MPARRSGRGGGRLPFGSGGPPRLKAVRKVSRPAAIRSHDGPVDAPVGVRQWRALTRCTVSRISAVRTAPILGGASQLPGAENPKPRPQADV